jgi:hyaluronoglucosaminidase
MDLVMKVILCSILCCFIGLGSIASEVFASARADETIPCRGIIEGFYGTPWTQAERLDMLHFLHEHDMNIYIYAPKDDPYHREKWREPYPGPALQDLQELIDAARREQVEFVFALSPGLDLHFSGASGRIDRDALLEKFYFLYDKGVRRFAVFFDDIANKDGVQQAEFLDEVNRLFVHIKPDVRPLLTVPTEYFTADMLAGDEVKTYTRGFAAHLDKDIVVMYTGPGVVCEGISADDINKVSRIYGRRMAVWWNYPVSDYKKEKLALGPIVGLAADAAPSMAAILYNPMEHAQLSKIALATGADYARNPGGYDAAAAWQLAIGQQYGKLAPDMQEFASHSQRMDNDWAHVGCADAAPMRQHMDAFWQDFDRGRDTSAAAAGLREDIAAMQTAAKHLQGQLDLPQLAYFAQLAEADETALELLEAKQSGHKMLQKVLRRQLVLQQQALLANKKAVLSERTALSFIKETLLRIS